MRYDVRVTYELDGEICKEDFTIPNPFDLRELENGDCGDGRIISILVNIGGKNAE